MSGTRAYADHAAKASAHVDQPLRPPPYTLRPSRRASAPLGTHQRSRTLSLAKSFEIVSGALGHAFAGWRAELPPEAKRPTCFKTVRRSLAENTSLQRNGYHMRLPPFGPLVCQRNAARWRQELAPGIVMTSRGQSRGSNLRSLRSSGQAAGQALRASMRSRASKPLATR